MKYRITYSEQPSSIGSREGYIYLDVDFTLQKVSGIYERSSRTGRAQHKIFGDHPAPDWVGELLKIPGTKNAHVSRYDALVTHAPLFDQRKIGRRMVRIIKNHFAQGRQLEEVKKQPTQDRLLPEDLEHDLRQIIEDYQRRRRRWPLRKKKR